MKFLDLTIDLAFKRVFGNQAKSSITMSFLNSILDLPEGEKIQSVIITDPYNQQATMYLKRSVVDVRCTDQMGRQFIIEVQVENQDNYLQRSQYYAALAISRQLESGALYTEIVPVIFIGVLSFNLFPEPDCINSFGTVHLKSNRLAMKQISYTFIELKKFTKTLAQLETIADKWIYLLKYAASLDCIPQAFDTTAELHDALELLNQGTMNRTELRLYDQAVEDRRNEENIKRTQLRIMREEGREEGRQEGRQEGRAEGRQEGRAEGRAEGKREAMIALAKNMLEHLPIEKVANITGISVDELKKL